MLSTLKKITAESKEKLDAEYEQKDKAIFDFLFTLTKDAYTQLKETAHQGKNRKYVICRDKMYKLENMIMDLYSFKYPRYNYCQIERILKKFIEKMGGNFDVPLKLEPSYYTSTSYERKMKYWYSEDFEDVSSFGDIYFDWSDEVTASDQEVTASDQEVTTSDQKVTTSDQEVTASDQEVTTSDQKVTASDQKVTASDQKVTTSDQKVTASDQQDEDTSC